jgi:diguanylate cyclase (GGDEF)-like protein
VGESLDLGTWLPLVVLGAVAGGALGWSIASRRAALLGEEAEEERQRRMLRERTESERAMAQLRSELGQIESEAKEHAEVFQILPSLVRRMFATQGGRRAVVGPLALKLANELFDPEQAAIFTVRHVSADALDEDFLSRGEPRLVLAAGSGLPPELTPGYQVAFGRGPVGWVAEHRRAMDATDLAARTGIARRAIDEGIPGFPVEVAAPFENDSELQGVFAMGGVRKRRGQEKRLLKMVADLTSVALIYNSRLRYLEDAANLDGLTGVHNKRYLERRMGDELHRAEQEHIPLSLLIMDIDHFKNYNDTNGHMEGDQVLKVVGEILRRSIREDDVAARYGGEEFVIIYTGTPKDVGLRLAEKLRRTVEGYTFRYGEKQPLGRVTLSGGVANFPDDARNAVDLMKSADQALYEAKSLGRNRIVGAGKNYLT